MNFLDLLITSIALSMDAFAVSICRGLSVKKAEFKHCITAGLWFGIFQALMPLIGYFCGSLFAAYITAWDHWITFAILTLIGINMIVESFKKEENDVSENPFGVKEMFPLAVATSIDALTVGITFSFINVNIFLAVLCIGSITLVLSAIGVKIGNVFGAKKQSVAEFCGGAALIFIAVKILLEHLGVI